MDCNDDVFLFWNKWFELNFSEVPEKYRKLYSEKLSSKQIYTIASLQRNIQKNSSYLFDKIEIYNEELEESVKSLVYSVSAQSTSPTLSQLADHNVINEIFDFQPVVTIGISSKGPLLMPVTDVTKISHDNCRELFTGSFSVLGENKSVVIKKKLRSTTTSNELSREANIYQQNKNSHFLVELLHFDEKSPDSYIVLEKFGVELCHFLNSKCEFKPTILQKLVVSLKSFHDAGYVHCDLKPHNVLVRNNAVTGEVQVKLCDFECTVKVGDLFLHDQHNNHTMKYSEQWVSPEVYFGQAGELRASKAMDIFGLGLIAGVLFDNDSHANKTILPIRNNNIELYERYLSDEIYLHSLIPCHKARYREIVHQMCCILPENRPTDEIIFDDIVDNTATKNHAHRVNAIREMTTYKESIGDKLDSIVENQEIIIQKLDAISDQLVEFGGKMRQIMQQNREIQQLFDVLMDNEYDCPTLFVCLPVTNDRNWSSRFDPTRIIQDHYRLFFMCAQTLELVPCGPDGNGYLIKCNKQWVVKAAPYIKFGLLLLKEVLQTYHIPLPIAQTLNLLGNNTEIHVQFINMALSNVSDSLNKTVDTTISAVIDSIERSPEASQMAYTAVKNMLKSGDYWTTVGVTCGLQRVRHGAVVAWIKKNEAVKKQFMDKIESIVTSKQIISHNIVTQAQLTAPPAQSIAPNTTTSRTNPIVPNAIPATTVSPTLTTSIVSPLSATVTQWKQPQYPIQSYPVWSCCGKSFGSGCSVKHTGKHIKGKVFGGKWSCCDKWDIQDLYCSALHSGTCTGAPKNFAIEKVVMKCKNFSKKGWHICVKYFLVLPDNIRVVCAMASSGSFLIFNMVSGKLEKEFNFAIHHNIDCSWIGLSGLALLPNGNLVSSSLNGTIIVWNIVTGSVVRELNFSGTRMGRDGAHCLTTTADGSIICGFGDKKIYCWSASDKLCSMVWSGHTAAVRCIVLLPDGRFATGSDDTSIRIWNTTSDVCEVVLTGHTRPVNCIAVLSQNQIVSGSADYSIKVWDISTRQMLKNIEFNGVERREPESISILTDNHIVVRSNRIDIVNLTSMKCEAVFTYEHRNEECMQVLSNGKIVTSGSHGLHVWGSR